MKILLTVIAGLVSTISAPLAAQADRDMVSANQPAGIVLAMLNAGYDAELSTDDLGDPLINSRVADYPLSIYFYGCDDTTHADCDSVQLVTGFDRKMPWTAQAALELTDKYRFAAVRLDDEGDPFLLWDIFTDEGIPTRVFVKSLRSFEDTVRLAAEIVFADEPEE